MTAGVYRLAAAGDCSDSVEVLEWNTLAAVAAHVAYALMASTGGVTVDDAAPGVGGGVVVVACEAPEGGNIVAACTVRRGCGAVLA